MPVPKGDSLVLWFRDISAQDGALVGGKNANLGEMYKELTQKGVNVPNGFAITTNAYKKFLQEANIIDKIEERLKGLNKNDERDLEERGASIRKLILDAKFPDDLNQAISEAYTQLVKEYKMENLDVAVRSSATAEDLPDASFAGQQESYLNICGKEDLLLACKKCMASLFTNRAISYREDKHFDHFKVFISVGVQRMVRSDKASSGVMFTIDTESGFSDVVLINGTWGLGENVVQGSVNPDEFMVFKTTLKEGKRPIIKRILGAKDKKMIYSTEKGKTTVNVETPPEEAGKFCLTDEQVLQLSRWACTIEEHYTSKRNKFSPMDIEWALDGITKQLFIVQARLETIHTAKTYGKVQKYVLSSKGAKVLCKGASIGKAIGAGPARVLKDVTQMSEFKHGEVLITEMTDPDWEPILACAKAIVTNRGGRTCHAAIISRELKIPCVVGCGNATELLEGVKEVTVNCSEGEVGKVHEGILDFKIQDIDLGALPKIKTKINVNVATPETAMEISFLPIDGVGLARIEFIISDHIKCHPMALLHPEKVDKESNEKIAKLIRGYPSGVEYFVDRLAQGVGVIGAAFYPRKVIVRFSDFKTNEYANLIGGKPFEPKEANPMIGWRGASRYYHDNYKEAFALECAAIKRVRETFGLDNVQVMIPFVRTVEEVKKVIECMKENGLVQHENGLQVIMMCEVPSNYILRNEFLDIVDGYSIGSNDLTQLILGVDRNSEIVSSVFDERNEAIKHAIKLVVEAANQRGKYIGICGQAPSDFPDFASFLVDIGIKSMSLNSDTVLSTIYKIAETEKKHQ